MTNTPRMQTFPNPGRKMPKYDADETDAFCGKFPSDSSKLFPELARDNGWDGETDVFFGFRKALNIDSLAEKQTKRNGNSVSSCDMAFKLDNKETLLCEMKLKIKKVKDLNKQLKKIPKKADGSVSLLRDYGEFHQDVYVVFDKDLYAESRDRLARIFDSCGQSFKQTIKGFESCNMPEFCKIFRPKKGSRPEEWTNEVSDEAEDLV